MTANKTAKIQFYEGTDEPVVPEIRLTRSKDGTTAVSYTHLTLPTILLV